MDLLIIIILFLIFLVSLVLIHTRKRSIKKHRNFMISFLIVILIIIFGMAIYDVFFIKSKSNLIKKEQFGSGKVSKKNKLMDICGLPKNYRDTSHCFNDSTHRTVCWAPKQENTQ